MPLNPGGTLMLMDKSTGCPMRCQRCEGLLVRENCDELRYGTGGLGPATRCINCGCIEDSVVRVNRLHPPMAQRMVSHGMVRKGGVVFLRSQSEAMVAVEKNQGLRAHG